MAGVGIAHISVGGMKFGCVFCGDYRIKKFPTDTHQIDVALNTNDRVHIWGR